VELGDSEEARQEQSGGSVIRAAWERLVDREQREAWEQAAWVRQAGQDGQAGAEE
jgi:hypothetical protein